MRIDSRNIQNPLALALGHFFSVERSFLRETSKEIALKIGIGDSFYRMIEGGAANLHPSKALKIIKAFPNSNINFDGLCKFIITTQTIESCRDIAELKTVLIELNSDKKNRHLLKFFEPVWKLIEKGNDDFADLVKTEVIYNELRDYFSNYDAYTNDPIEKIVTNKENLNAIFNNLPTIYYDYVEDYIKRTLELPVKIVFSELWNWEKKNKSRFRNLFAVIKEHNFVTNIENLKRYKYWYLWEEKFETANFIYFDNDSPDKVEKIFKQNLYKVLKADNYLRGLEKFETGIKKVSFKKMNHDLQLLNNDILKFFNKQGDEGVIEEDYSAFWTFDFFNGNKVGFMSIIDPENVKMADGRSLPYNVVEKKLREFIRVWDKL